MVDGIPDQLYGRWEYQKMVINGKEVSALELNECRYRDQLMIDENIQEEYKLDSENLKGLIVGYSNKQVCIVDPISYQYKVIQNSCEALWFNPSNDASRLFKIQEGVCTEYNIQRLDRMWLVLEKVRDIIDTGVVTPDRIELMKVI
ncbi:MAG: hypothetical protein AAFY76_21840 [Cyanobacteria bacterium J06649_11]